MTKYKLHRGALALQDLCNLKFSNQIRCKCTVSSVQETKLCMSCMVVFWLYRMQWPGVCRAVSISTYLNQCVPPCCLEEMPQRSLLGPGTPHGLKAKFNWNPCLYACHRSVWTPDVLLYQQWEINYQDVSVIFLFLNTCLCESVHVHVEIEENMHVPVKNTW